MQLFPEVLNHVVSFRFTVDQEIDTDLLLEADDDLDFFFDKFLIFNFGDLAFSELSASLTNLLGLL